MNGVPATFATAVGSFKNPGDIYAYSAPESKWTRLTRVNQALLDGLHLSIPENIKYKSFDGWEVEGWVMKPIGFKEGTKYPAILEIHGGPHSAYGNAFFMEMQLHAADGFAVIFTNPRGSESYGQQFVAATKHDWGVGDYKDIIAGVDHAISLGWIDETRLGLTGGSYGGYMTNWMIGQTQRFIAGVACRSTSNRYSQFGISDAAYNNGDFEFPGTPWDNPLYYLEKSPITYVKNITTPLLLISNESDLRCPIAQAEEMFTALKLLRKTVEMVRIPNESHELSRSGQPAHRVERYERMNGWFKKYIERPEEDYAF
jgi:dipeptidyl aminopeptidase/acylaminoacyl peptidase